MVIIRAREAKSKINNNNKKLTVRVSQRPLPSMNKSKVLDSQNDNISQHTSQNFRQETRKVPLSKYLSWQPMWDMAAAHRHWDPHQEVAGSTSTGACRAQFGLNPQGTPCNWM